MIYLRYTLLLLASLVVFPLRAAPLPIADLDRNKPVDFATEIFPVLKANCLACHNSTKAKADLILESPEDMLKGGDSGPAIEIGNADDSLLFTTAAHIEEPVMPPPNNKSNAENLSPLELALFRQWIKEGAKGERVATAAPKSWTHLSGSQPIYTSALTRDGRFAAVGRGQAIDLYDLRLGKLVASLEDVALPFSAAHADMVRSLAFSPNQTLASGGFRTMKLWQRQGMVKVGDPITLTSPPQSSVLSVDGSSFALGLADGSVQLFNLGGDLAAPPVSIKDHTAAVTGLAISADNSWIYSTSADKTVRGRSLTEINTTQIHQLAAPATAISLVGPEMLLVATSDFNLHLFSTTDLSKKLASQKIVASQVIAIHHSATDTAIAYQNGTILRCKIDSAKANQPLQEINKILHGAPLVNFSASDSHFATAAQSGGCKLWNRKDGKLITELKSDAQLPLDLDILNRQVAVQNRIAAYWKKKAPESEKLWKSESEKAQQAGAAIAKAKITLKSKQAAVAAIKDNPAALTKANDELKTASLAITSATRNRDDSSRLAGEALVRHSMAQATVLEAETTSAELKKQIEVLTKQISESNAKYSVVDLAFSPDGTTLAVATKEHGIQHHEASSGKWVESVDLSVEKIDYTDRSRFSFLKKGNQLQKWTTGKQWQLVKTIGDGKSPDPFSDRVAAIAFSPDGGQCLTGGGVPSRNGEVTLWQTSDWSVLKKNSKAHTDTISAFAFSPDGQKFVSGATDRLVKTFDTATLEKRNTFEGHTSHVLDVDWNADGLSLASAGADLQAKTWDLETLKEKSKIAGFQREVSTVLFFADSDALLTASGDKSLKVSNKPISGSGQTFLHTAAASSSGSVIIAAGQDSVLRVYDGKTRKLVREFSAPKSESEIAGR